MAGFVWGRSFYALIHFSCCFTSNRTHMYSSNTYDWEQTKLESEQESIPVWCVPTAEVACTGGGGVGYTPQIPYSLDTLPPIPYPRIPTPLDTLHIRYPTRMDTPGYPTPLQKGHVTSDTPAPGKTIACENISFPQLLLRSIIKPIFVFKDKFYTKSD